MVCQDEKTPQGSNDIMNCVTEFIRNIYELRILDKIWTAVIFANQDKEHI